MNNSFLNKIEKQRANGDFHDLKDFYSESCDVLLYALEEDHSLQLVDGIFIIYQGGELLLEQWKNETLKQFLEVYISIARKIGNNEEMEERLYKAMIGDIEEEDEGFGFK